MERQLSTKEEKMGSLVESMQEMEERLEQLMTEADSSNDGAKAAEKVGEITNTLHSRMTFVKHDIRENRERVFAGTDTALSGTGTIHVQYKLVFYCFEILRCRNIHMVYIVLQRDISVHNVGLKIKTENQSLCLFFTLTTFLDNGANIHLLFSLHKRS